MVCQGTFVYYKLEDQDRPLGWSNLPEDLEYCFHSSPSHYFGVKAPIPILYMRDTGYEYLMEGLGNIYTWNLIGDTLHRMEEPETLGELLAIMSEEEHVLKFRHCFSDNPRTKWQKLDSRERSLPEHNL